MRFLLTYLFLFFAGQSFALENFTRTLKLMGSKFEITVVAINQADGDHFINLAVEEIQRIEKMISSWDPNSQTSEIIKNAGIKPVKVDRELFQLIERSIQISKITNGAFDISYASMDRIWKFDGTMKDIPDKETIKNSVSKVGYQNIVLNKNENSVFLKLQEMKIGFGAIGKGYAADKAKALLIQKGVVAGLINASGDLNCWGNKADGSPWMVGISNPLNKNKVFSWFPIENSAVVTSGNYEKYVMIDGKRYAHIIDPRTGYPTQEISSASVFAPKAELADALATSIFVMGIETGLDFINQLAGIECIIVDDKGKVFYSENIEKKTDQK